MKIWVDADACPVVIRDIIYRAAKRTGLETILVANAPGGSEGVAVCGRGDRADAAQGVAAFSVLLSCTLRKLMLARGTH